jgi:hypothetical protein
MEDPELHRRCRLGGLARLAAVANLAVALSLAVFLVLGASGHHHLAQAAGRRASAGSRPASPGVPFDVGQAEVTVGAHAPVTPIPPSFLGFSTEYWTLPVDERHIGLYRRVLSLVHVPGDGRFVLRIGGDSSDHAFWDPTKRPLPHWAFMLTPSWVARTARVVRDMHLRVIVDLNTVTSTPRLAADWARAAEARLPRASIIGFEVGNEPNLYDRNLWAFSLGGTALHPGLLPRRITAQSYRRQYGAYERGLDAVAPRVPLLGPALANPYRDRSWIAALLAGPHPALSAVSVHRYPYTACSLPRSPAFPTVARILSEHASAGTAQAIAPEVRMAHDAGLPIRVTELNSVTCGGRPGVSNTFATALWAPDVLFALARTGVAGVNLHVRVFSVNAPFRFDAGGVEARPLLYGLALFTRMLGPQSRLVTAQLRTGRSLHLKVWAVRVGSDTLNVLMLDKGSTGATVHLRLPATGAAQVQRLLAPSASSESHVTLDGQWLDDGVRWRGRRAIQTLAPQRHDYTVRLRGVSAAMLTVKVA